MLYQIKEEEGMILGSKYGREETQQSNLTPRANKILTFVMLSVVQRNTDIDMMKYRSYGLSFVLQPNGQLEFSVHCNGKAIKQYEISKKLANINDAQYRTYLYFESTERGSNRNETIQPGCDVLRNQNSISVYIDEDI